MLTACQLASTSATFKTESRLKPILLQVRQKAALARSTAVQMGVYAVLHLQPDPVAALRELGVKALFAMYACPALRAQAGRLRQARSLRPFAAGYASSRVVSTFAVRPSEQSFGQRAA